MSARLLAVIVCLLLVEVPARAQEPPLPPPPVAPVHDVWVAPATDGPYPPAAPYPPPSPYPPPVFYPPYPPPPYAPPYEDRPSRHGAGVTAKFSLGPSYERIFDVPIYSVDAIVALGGQRGISGWYGEVEAVLGRTDHGLTSDQFWAGGTWEATIQRVHLGVGLHLGFLGIRRATTGALMTSVGLGTFGFATVDLYQTGEAHALYLGARLTANWMDGDTLLWGPSAMLGWRY